VRYSQLFGRTQQNTGHLRHLPKSLAGTFNFVPPVREATQRSNLHRVTFGTFPQKLVNSQPVPASFTCRHRYHRLLFLGFGAFRFALNNAPRDALHGLHDGTSRPTQSAGFANDPSGGT
jgi:hypothetical protein